MDGDRGRTRSRICHPGIRGADGSSILSLATIIPRSGPNGSRNSLN